MGSFRAGAGTTSRSPPASVPDCLGSNPSPGTCLFCGPRKSVNLTVLLTTDMLLLILDPRCLTGSLSSPRHPRLFHGSSFATADPRLLPPGVGSLWVPFPPSHLGALTTWCNFQPPCLLLKPFPLPSVSPNSPAILRLRSNVASSRKPSEATLKPLMAKYRIYLL